MVVPQQNLLQQLNGKLSPIYLVAGDETLLINESYQAIKNHAKAHGFVESELFDKPNAADVEFALNSRSLFSTKKCIELRFDKAKLTAELKQTLLHYCNTVSDDYLLLVQMPKLTAAETKQAWFKAIDKVGLIVQIWPLPPQQFVGWLKQRLKAAGISCDEACYAIIAAQTEGNLLAAAQEIYKLTLNGPRHFTAEDISELLANNSQYNVFELADAVLGQQTAQCLKILARLKTAAAEPAIVLWTICQDLRKLVYLLQAAEPFSVLCEKQQIWRTRQKLFQQAMNRLQLPMVYKLLQYATHIDAMIKGIEPGNPWHALQDLCLRITNPTN